MAEFLLRGSCLVSSVQHNTSDEIRCAVVGTVNTQQGTSLSFNDPYFQKHRNKLSCTQENLINV